MWQPIQDGSTNIFKARNWQGRQLAQDDDTAQCPSEETAMTMIPIHPKYPLYLLPVEASVSRHLQMFACTTNGTVQTTLVVALSLVYAWQPVGPPLLGATIFALDDHRRLITINNATNTLMLHATSNGQIAWQSQEVVPPYDNQTTTTTHAWLLENEDDTIFVMDKNNDSNAIYVRIYNQTAETWLVESELKLVLPSVDAAGLSTSTDNPQTVLVTVASVSTTESTVALSSLLYDQMTAQWQEYGTFALPSHDAVSWLLAGNGRTHVTTDRNGMLRVLRKNENNTEWTTIYKFNPSILLQLQDDEEGFDVESKALSWDGSILAVTYTGKGSHGVMGYQVVICKLDMDQNDGWSRLSSPFRGTGHPPLLALSQDGQVIVLHNDSMGPTSWNFQPIQNKWKAMGALPPPVEHPDDTVQTVHFVASGSLAVATWKNSVRAYEYIIAS